MDIIKKVGSSMELLVDEIYHNVFCNIIKGNVDLFLCGAASTKKDPSYRDKLREKLKNYNRISVLYPEDLFLELLNRKKYDLLTLEKILADNSDYIVIVCESPGSFTELGAFVNNNDTVDKVIVLLQTKYKNSKSFIRQGPVQFVYSKNKDHVIFYNTDVSEVAKKIKRVILPARFATANISFKDIDTISGQYVFILILLYFFEKMPIKELKKYIKDIFQSKAFLMRDFEIYFSAAIRRLFKEGLLSKSSSNNSTIYQLTDKGYLNAINLLSYANLDKKTNIYNNIRMRIINIEDKNQHHSLSLLHSV